MGEFKGPNIVGKIDLSKFEKPKKIDFEKMSSFLKGELKFLSAEINNEYQEFGQILENDATIKIEGSDASLHREVVLIKEQVWASEKNCTVEEWNNKKEKDPATVSEMFITLLLHKVLKDRFLVARASYYDDYENGIDYVLIDKKTGAVVCGFDQVLGIGKDDGGAKKKQKIDRILLRGGARLEYGITFDKENNLIRKKLRNIPTFFLGLAKDDLDKSLNSLQKNNNLNDQVIEDFGKNILKKMVKSLEGQYFSGQDLIKKTGDKNRYEMLLDNIDRFKESLEIIKNKINL
jgi:hypothetical protein